MHRIWCGRAIGAPIRSPANAAELAGRDPLGDEGAEPVEAAAAEELLVEVADHVGDVDVGRRRRAGRPGFSAPTAPMRIRYMGLQGCDGLADNDESSA